MRLLVVSDLHFEFLSDGGAALTNSLTRDVDAVVLAGDLSDYRNLARSLDLICNHFSHVPVLYVAGNHEYYGANPPSTRVSLLRAVAKHGNLRWLDNSLVELSERRLFGATLWFRHDPLNELYARHLSDFTQIGDFRPWVYDENRKTEQELRRFFSIGTPPDVVITHHLPTTKCIDPRYATSPLNRFFVSPVAETMEKLPKLWIFGHTHSHVDIEWRGCRFIANPLGYPVERDSGFNPNLVVEV